MRELHKYKKVLCVKRSRTHTMTPKKTEVNHHLISRLFADNPTSVRYSLHCTGYHDALDANPSLKNQYKYWRANNLGADYAKLRQLRRQKKKWTDSQGVRKENDESNKARSDERANALTRFQNDLDGAKSLLKLSDGHSGATPSSAGNNALYWPSPSNLPTRVPRAPTDTRTESVFAP